jgi:hypothetical protein
MLLGPQDKCLCVRIHIREHGHQLLLQPFQNSGTFFWKSLAKAVMSAWFNALSSSIAVSSVALVFATDTIPPSGVMGSKVERISRSSQHQVLKVSMAWASSAWT